MKAKSKKINILFVCRYNRFRSRIAEACFNKINKNKNIKARSAGVIKGSPLSKYTINIAKELGLDIRGKTKGLSSKLMVWQNLTVVVANDVPPALFDRNKEYGKKVIIWKIQDVSDKNKKGIKKIIKTILNKTKALVKSLEDVR